MDIYFNSIPGPNAGAVDKDKRNALVPTSIVYTGGTMDFPMDMGPDVRVFSLVAYLKFIFPIYSMQRVS